MEAVSVCLRQILVFTPVLFEVIPIDAAVGVSVIVLQVHRSVLWEFFEGGDEFGGVFQMNPDKVYLTDAEYAEMIQKIKDNL